ncbi:hypothetical protein QFC21_004709 [Naganishia friedmannii]|uniref:Uncharacterized protein n=1 Tax=Naganishia friedmannii TaxID=89922 RepID=A0ACC2VEC9_9TREE|nr:hypothetical protein QFC21_004709 [Naganishia friedmannii]
MENVKAATEQCQGLREEFAAVQRASSDAHRTSLAALGRERESLREGLESQIQSLTAENEALSDDNLTLQKALIKAETLAETLKDHLEDAKLNALQLEESHRAEDKAREIAYRSLEDEFDKLKQEFQKAKALVSSHETKMQELQAKIDTHAEDFNLQLQAHEMELSNEKHAAILKEKGLTADLSTLKAEYEATRNALTKSESDVQQKDGERQAIIEKYKQLKSRFKELQTGYEASVKDVGYLHELHYSLVLTYRGIPLAQRESVAKNGSELAIELRQESQKSFDLERRLERLGKELADVAKGKGRLEADLTAAKNACESYLNCAKETEGKYASLQDEVEELKKRAEDGQAAHSEDVTKERAKYDLIKASQESLKKRYQAGDLTRIEQDVLELHVEKIITEKDEELTTVRRAICIFARTSLTASLDVPTYQLKHKLTAAETEASRWRKTAGRASKEKSQQLGGPSLIGSDFEDQSSSPHEPLRSALSRTEHAPLIDFGNAVEVSAQAPSTPLTDIASSPKEQDVRPQTQTLTSFLSGATSTTKRVSFQELAGDASDEMDNDVPDTLGRIAGEEDEMEEDIEESESLMDTVETFTARIASSIENFTQPANKHASVQSDKSIRSEISGAVAAPAKSTQNKIGNAALGMIRSTRSQTQATTYSGASRKRVASIVVGNDMESFTSTQEDAIYGKRGAIKKQRR